MAFIKDDPNINRGGRPKGSVGLKLTTLLKDKLNKVSKKDKKKFSELFIDKLVDKALLDNDTQALKLILNYVDGLPTQKLDIETEVKIYNWADYKDN